jgi:hypothetical protein
VIRYIMPWQATGPLDLTLLRAPGRRLTKLITSAGIIDYDQVALFAVDAIRFDSIDDVPELLLDLADRHDTCVVRAVVKDPLQPFAQIRRLLHDHGEIGGRFREVARQWVMIDLEPNACPVDPTDPMLVGGWLRRRLPKPFQMARCVVQLSSGAGIKPGARAHVWFVLDRPLVNAELDRLLGSVDGLDTSTFRAVQIHYTASPQFDGVDDPCVQGRIAVLPGYAEVRVPELAPERPRQAFSPTGSPAGARAFALVEAHAYVPPVRGLGSEAPRARQYMLACIRGLAGAPFGHGRDTCMRVALRLYGMAKAGLLDPADITARLKGTMVQAQGWSPDEVTRGRTLADVNRQLQWAWDHAEPRDLKP